MTDKFISIGQAAQVHGPFNRHPSGGTSRPVNEDVIPAQWDPLEDARRDVIRAILDKDLRSYLKERPYRIRKKPKILRADLSLLRADVERWSLGNPILGGDTSTHWCLPVALAWVATGSLDEAKYMNCLVAWPHNPTLRLPGFTETGQRTSLRRLFHLVANHHCICGAQPAPGEEKWQSCCCLENALEKIATLVAKGTIEAVLDDGGSISKLDTLRNIVIEREYFSIQASHMPGAIKLSRSQVIEYGRKEARPHEALGKPKLLKKDANGVYDSYGKDAFQTSFREMEERAKDRYPGHHIPARIFSEIDFDRTGRKRKQGRMPNQSNKK